MDAHPDRLAEMDDLMTEVRTDTRRLELVAEWLPDAIDRAVRFRDYYDGGRWLSDRDAALADPEDRRPILSEDLPHDAIVDHEEVISLLREILGPGDHEEPVEG